MKQMHRTARVAVIALAGFGLVFGSGCKDEAPAPPAVEAAQEAGQKAGEAVDQAAKAVGETAKKAGEKAADVAKKAVDAVPKVAAKASTRGIPALGEGVPSTVMGMVGTSSFKNLLAMVTSIADRVAPGQLPPNLETQAMIGLQGGFGFKSSEWIDLNKPMRGVIVDPKTYEGGAALLFPITTEDAAKAAFPANAKAGEGHAAAWEHSGETIFADFVRGHLVLTRDAPLFGALKGYFGGAALAWVPTIPFAATGQMPNIAKAFAAELAEAKTELLRIQMDANREQGLGESKELAQKQVDIIFGLIEGTTELSAGTVLNGDIARMTFGAIGKSGGAIEAMSAVMKSDSSAFAGFAPPTTWLGATSGVDMRAVPFTQDLMDFSVDTYTDLLNLNAEERAKAEKLVKDMAALSTGNSVMALYTTERFPMAMLSVSEVTDAALATATYKAFMTFAFAKGWDLAKAEAKKNPSFADANLDAITSFSELLVLLNTFGGGVGISVKQSAQTEGAFIYDALTFNIDWERTGLREEDPNLYPIIKDVVGPTMELVLGVQDKRMVFTFGPKGLAHATQAASGKEFGGEPALTRASKSNAMSGTLRVGAAMEAFAFVPELAEMKDAIATIPKDQAFVSTVTSTDGKEAVFNLDMPLQLLAALVGLAL